MNYWDERSQVRSRTISYGEFIIDAVEACKTEYDLDISQELAWDMVKRALVENEHKDYLAYLANISTSIYGNDL